MKKTILVILFFIVQQCCWAIDNGSEYSNNLSYSNGLVGESMRKMCIDHMGRAWMVTSTGVNIFNGVRVQAIRLKDEDGVNIRTYDVCEGMENSMFVGTAKGVYEQKYGTWKFVNILPNIATAENLFYDGHALYIGSKEGLLIYDGKHLKKVNMGKRPHLDYLPRGFQKDGQGNIWFITRYTLCTYHPQTGKLSSRQVTQRLPYNSFLGNFALYKQTVYLGTTNNGLFRMNLKTGVVEKVTGLGNMISSVAMSLHHSLCVGTRGSGAYILNAETGEILRHFAISEEGANHLPTDMVDYFQQDKNGVNWFGLSRYGVAYTYYNSQLFKPYSFRGFSSAELDVRCFSKRGGELVIGTHNGFYYINEQNGVCKYFSPNGLNGAHVINKIMYYGGKYYIGSFDRGLMVFDPHTLKVVTTSIHPLLNMCSISEMKISPKGDLCIGTNEGLFVLDKQGHCMRYAEQNSRISGGSVNSIVFDHAGNAWICASSELCMYLASSKDFETSLFPKGFFNKSTTMKMSNGHGQRLFAVSKNQVYETNEKMTKFGKVDIPREFAEDVCRFFIDDMKNYYWMASEKGLFRFNYAFSEMQHFGSSEGVREEYINGASADENGDLWLSTSKGLLFAHRKDLEKWRQDARGKVQVYQVRIGENMIDDGLETVINDEAFMRIPWNFTSSSLVMKPTLVDYSKEAGRLYEYRIDGDKKWKLVHEGNEINITSLFLGVHHVKIRLLGLPNTERDFRLLVVPSVAAIIEAVLGLIALFLFLWWRRFHKDTKALLSEKNEMEGALMEIEQQNVEQQVRLETEETLGQQKYARVKIDEQECAQIVERMKELVAKDKLYANPDLKMADLAEMLGLSSSKMSLVFSLYLKENYYEFINKYRLEEFKHLIADGEYKKYTLTALSEKCGFKKTSFFSTFRKVEGMTPMEYLKRQNIKF